MSQQDPRQGLILEIQRNVDAFQGVAGKANATTISAVTTILNTMGNTIMTQYDEIQKLRAEIVKLTPKKEELPVNEEKLSPTHGKMADG